MMEVSLPTRIKPAEQSLALENDDEPHRLSPQIHNGDMEDDDGVDVERDAHEDYELTELKTMSSKQDRPDTPLEELTEDNGEHNQHMQQNPLISQGSRSGDNLNFKLALIDAVRPHRCLYDPSDANYISRQSTFRSMVWDKLANDLNWNGDSASLQKEWKQLRDKYVRHLRKTSNDSLMRERHPSEGDDIIDSMQWLREYVNVNHQDRGVPVSLSGHSHSAAGSLTQTQSTGSHQSSREVYFVEPQTMDHDVMISGYQSQSSSHSMSVPTSQSHSSHTTHRSIAQSHQQNEQSSIGHSHQQVHTESPAPRGNAGGYYIVRNPGGSNHSIRILNQQGTEVNTSSSSSSPRVTVVPTTRVNGSTILHLQPGQVLPRNASQRVHILHTPSSSHSSQFEQRPVSLSEPGVTVTASGNAGMIGHVKKDQSSNGVSMVVDPTPYFHTGNQKVYRLVNMSDVHDMQSGSRIAAPPLKRAKYGGSRIHQSHSHHHQHHHQSMVSLAPPSSRVVQQSMQELGEEVIIDDGIQDRTIVIDQDHQDVNDPDSPMLSDSPGMGSMMLSGHQTVGPSRLQAGGQQQRGGGMQHHIQQHVPDGSMSASPGPHPGYLQQDQYDADLQFQQLISTSLSRYDDDNKALMKWNIQRILLEARYGAGMCHRIIEEENKELTVDGVVAHEMVPQ